MKRKSGKLYVKGYDNSYNKCIDKKDIVIQKWAIVHISLIENKIGVKLNLSKYATKSDLKYGNIKVC